MLSAVKKLFLDIFFPQFCFNCQKEGSYLCQDCLATLEILREHQKYSGRYLNDLYWALPYQGALTKKLIHNFKYEPFAKELAKTLAFLIIDHFQLIENPSPFLGEGSSFILIPVPLHKKRLKWRGFNQATELAKELSSFLEIPWFSDCLIKTKETVPQVELEEKAREKNVLGAFLVKNKNSLLGKRVLLVDDIFTTGATMEECARVLKESGAKKVIGIVVARG